jgi:PKHD-type hydroxylase
MNTSGYFFQPSQRGHFNSHFQYSDANRLFSEPECDAIIALAEKAGFGNAAIGNPDQTRVDESYRAAEVALIPFHVGAGWLYERITQRMEGANGHYQFAITGLMEGLQVVRYRAPQSIDQQPGHYDWHQDFGAAYMSRRKLSLVAQLSAPEEYDGCRLTITDPGPRELVDLYQQRGAGVIFPSWTPHCVTAITRGTRYALVAWVHGEPFR